jgi:hypothetical protein
MIPKTIHYCWFGRAKKPKLVNDCIASWKIYFPDFKIIEWNEKNSDLTHPFVKEMYNQKRWAFVSDYIRLEKIYEYGGIYLDTDMMVLKSFESFLNNDCFFGAEDSDFISVGVIGATEKNRFIKECKEIYDSLLKVKDTNLGGITIPKLITKKFRTIFNYYNNFDEIISFEGVKIYPSEFFYPLAFDKKNDINNFESYLKKESVAVHLWSSSWIEYSEFHFLRNGNYSKGLTKVIRNLKNKENRNLFYIKKTLSSIKESIFRK